ncbi:ribonuclease H-like domain-containing protein [Tanacetum coccineum]
MVGTNHPTQRLNVHVSSISPFPKSYTDAFNDPNWQNVMLDEYNALIKSNSWTLVPRPTDTNIVRCMWLFHHKYLADDTLSRYKACLVANGSTQIEGIDVNETFSLIFKPGTIRTVLSLDTSRHWPVHQLDVKNAFLHKAPLWSEGTDTAYLLLYVDDIVLTASSGILLQRMFLSQRKYATEILERAHIGGCNSSQTPVDTNSKLGDDGDPICLYMHDPREPHFSALKWILRDRIHVLGDGEFGFLSYQYFLKGSAGREFLEKFEHFSHPSIDPFTLLENGDIIAEFCGPSRWKELSKESGSKILPCGDGSYWKTFKPIASLIVLK